MVVGVAAAGTGVALIVVSGADAGGVSLAPAAMPGGAGVLVSGTFP
jgi:hypothetical protein